MCYIYIYTYIYKHTYYVYITFIMCACVRARVCAGKILECVITNPFPGQKMWLHWGFASRNT
jgi:hypothetical protein